MDYEKKYNELVGKIEKAYLYAQTDSTKAVLEDIFPELKESMDERIRKSLINLFKIENFNGYTTLNGIDVDDVITWLEKQKTSEEAIKYLKENHSPSDISDFQAAMNIAVAKAYDRGRRDAEKQGEKSPFNKERLMEVAKPETFEEKIGHWQRMRDIAEKRVKEWLEKQRQQPKPAVDFRAEDWCVSKVDVKNHNIYNSEVGPKFKVGDWITIKE